MNQPTDAGEALLAQAPLHLVHVLQISAVDAYAGVYGGCLRGRQQRPRSGTPSARATWWETAFPSRPNALTTEP